MKLELGKFYIDRKGMEWLIIEVNGQKIAPVSGGRWEGKSYKVRTFQRNGAYWPNKEDQWDLVKEVQK